ncbi:arabinoxylan arabinofuranohydrolase [Hordeum vulgare]|nr:arabinoxylan arabinofuranohydrolase [Hordeum vulgare]
MNEMAGISSSEFPLGHVQLYRWLLIDVVHWLVVDVNQLIDCLSLCHGKVAYKLFIGLCVYLYDVHVYASSANMFSRTSMFDNTPRRGPKAIVSEYAVTGNDASKGTLLAALTEAAFLIGLEKNSDVVEMASCAPLFVNDNDRKWSPDAIVFNSWQHYGCPTYWMLHFFKDSSGATFHPATTQVSNYDQMVASATTWQSPKDKSTYLKIKVVNFDSKAVDHNITATELGSGIKSSGSKKTVLISATPLDENSFQQPEKVAPVSSSVADAKEQMGVSASSSEQVTDCVNVVGLTVLVTDMPQLPPEAMTDLWWDGSGTTMEILLGDRVIVLLWEHDYLK